MIEAQEMLQQMRCADFPMMKKEPRRKLHKDLYRAAHPEILRQGNKKELSGKDLASLINGA